MAEIYRSAEMRPSAEGADLVVHCSDPRFLPHFQDFCRTALKMDHYALIAVPGGPQVLTLLGFLPKFSWVGWRWVKFMVDLTRAERIVLIVHDDCRWYLQSLFGHNAARIHERMIEDAQKVRVELLERFGQRTIEIYHARLEGNCASFDRIT
jgi:hypothetical protein